MSFMFLGVDYRKLVAKRDDLYGKYRAAAQDTGVSSSKGKLDGEDEAHAEAMRDMNLLGQRLAEIDGVLREAQIIAGPKSNTTVAIGHLVCVLDTKSNEKIWYCLGSYIINGNDPSPEPDDGTMEHPYNVSYFSPVGRLIYGRAQSACFDLKLPSRPPRPMKIVEIVEVALSPVSPS